MITLFIILLIGWMIAKTSSLQNTFGIAASNAGTSVGTSDHCYVLAVIKTEQAVAYISFVATRTNLFPS